MTHPCSTSRSTSSSSDSAPPASRGSDVIAPTVFLLPPKGQPLDHWAVIACDQFGSDPSYWQNVAKAVGDDPSLLHCIIRDSLMSSALHSSSAQLSQQIHDVHRHMANYRSSLMATEPGVMLVERWLPGKPMPRQGVLVTIDLEHYAFRAGGASGSGARDNSALIRPTERTIEERLPIRHQLRLGASLDISHIMVLIDDPDRKIIEPQFRKLRQPSYSTELMQGGGHVTGSLLPVGAELSHFLSSFNLLLDPERYRARYHLAPENPLLMLVGDGNHSLAAAKLAWQSHKAAGAKPDHPSRYALVEVANLHSPALDFQPIHRLVRGLSGADLVEVAMRVFGGSSFAAMDPSLDFRGLFRQMMKNSEGDMAAGYRHEFPIKAPDLCGILTVPNPTAKLELGTIDRLLVELRSSARYGDTLGWDYVHDEDELARLALSEPFSVGLLMPRLDKSRFFESIIKDGPLPAKGFSVGEAHEKRYYLETRSLVPAQ